MNKVVRAVAVSAVCAFALHTESVFAVNRASVDPATGIATVVFDEVGDFTWRAPASQQVELLVVGGGGGGGCGHAGGGGGGGQVYHSTTFSVTGGTTYPVTVGAGGTGGTNGGSSVGRWEGKNGGDSIFGAITCLGGGGGGGNAGTANRKGVAGGNSGGASKGDGSYTSPDATGTNDVANGWYGGHKGGNSKKVAFGPGVDVYSGGGGGAMGEGGIGAYDAEAGYCHSGNGGDGYACSITGSTVYYACGGGGGAEGNGSGDYAMYLIGGDGGSGNASGGAGAKAHNKQGSKGTDGTGTGGGGGGWYITSPTEGGNGGSGIVVLRYVATTPVVELAPASGYLGIDELGVSVNVIYPEGAAVAYATSAVGPWSETPVSPTSFGTTTVWVKVSADGLSDFVSSVDVLAKDPSADNDGTFFFVSPSGSAEPPYATWATAANDLQTAVDSRSGAASDVRVLVESGRYVVSSPLDLANVRVTVVGYDRATHAVRKGCAVFDANGAGRVARVHSTKFRGCTFTGGYLYGDGSGTPDNGAGVYVYGCSDGTKDLFAECVFSNNVLAVLDGHATSGTTIRGGAGIYVNNGIVSGSGNRVRISDCTFCDNVVTAANNTVSMRGGGVWTRSATTFRRCLFERNVAFSGVSGNGPQGGAVIGDVAVHIVEDCTFISNRCYKTTGSQSHRSGLSLSVAGSRCFSSVFIGNTGADNGWCSVKGVVSNCVFKSNGNNNGCLLGTEIVNCAFYNNKGTLLYDADAKMRNCLVYGETGSVIWSHASGNKRVDCENCTFLNNSSVWYVYNNDTKGRTTSFVNCLFNGNTKDFNIGQTAQDTEGAYYCYMTNCCYGTSSNIGGFVTESAGCVQFDNPRFVDAAEGNYRLRSNSPLREKGMMLSWMAGATDLDGNPRVVDRRGKVSVEALPDIGCYECQDNSLGMMLLVR